jgi:hypothetical protein
MVMKFKFFNLRDEVRTEENVDFFYDVQETFVSEFIPEDKTVNQVLSISPLTSQRHSSQDQITRFFTGTMHWCLALYH